MFKTSSRFESHSANLRISSSSSCQVASCASCAFARELFVDSDPDLYAASPSISKQPQPEPGPELEPPGLDEGDGYGHGVRYGSPTRETCIV